MVMTAAELEEILEDEDISTTGSIRTVASKTHSADGSVTEGTVTNTNVRMSIPVTHDSYVKSGNLRSGGITLKEEFDFMTVISNSGISITPKKGLFFTFRGKTWTINEVGNIYGIAGELIGFELGLIK